LVYFLLYITTVSTNYNSKINQLINAQPPGIVYLSSWLVANGYSHNLQQRYKKSNWLKSIGAGALVRVNDKLNYEGAVYALQAQANLTIHPGARTALSILGKAHYLEMSAGRILLFGGTTEKLPLWFKRYNWGAKLEYHPTNFLPSDLGLIDHDTSTFSIRISGAARAMMECLYLAPKRQDLVECFQLMEGLNNLSPQKVQVLLEQCQSVKVKRLFLYMAEKAKHQWVEYLDMDKIDLGKGKRSVVKNGSFVRKYAITIPKELEERGESI